GVRAVRATRVLDAPGATQRQPRERLARVDDELEVRADVEDRDRRLHLVARPAARLAVGVRLALSEGSRRSDRLEQVVLEGSAELRSLPAHRADAHGLRLRERGGHVIRERVPRRLHLRVAAVVATVAGRAGYRRIGDRVL